MSVRFNRLVAITVVMILFLIGCSFSNAADCYEPPIAEDPPLPAGPPIPKGPAIPKSPPISEDPPVSDGPAIPAPYKGPKPYQAPEPYKPPEPYQPPEKYQAPEKYQPPSSMVNDKMFASISPISAQGTSSVESESTEVECTSISGFSIFSLLAAAILAIIATVFIFTVPVIGWSMLVGMAFGGLAGWLSGGSATEIAMDAVYGGIAGAVGLGAFAGAARLLGRMAMTSTWMGRWFPWLGSGGAAGVGETATFDFLRDGKVNWTNVLIAGALGGLLGFGGGMITDHGHKLKALIPQLENRVVVAADGPVGRFIYNHFDDAADGYHKDAGSGLGNKVSPSSKNFKVDLKENPKYRPATNKVDFDYVAKIRKDLGLPPINKDTGSKTHTVAVLESDGQQIWGRSGWGNDVGGYTEMRESWLKGGGKRKQSATNGQTAYHAEGDAFWHLYKNRKENNILGGEATLVVDRPLCKACGQNNGIQSLMEEVGLDKLVIKTPEGTQVLTPRPGRRRTSWEELDR
ncbi:deaminase [Desmospora profundinema]|uniref:MafB19-like deaminase domain-containing protein n=1 Tax=Desmospora profundinema TaxID=1571184 RepID=A0ABU1IS75_9BACL|nr:deaminase [Desmospora profundinema]MDR6227636.1 hypothetical protein [Desmospora profundinema]